MTLTALEPAAALPPTSATRGALPTDAVLTEEHLTEVDILRIRAALAAAHAPSTLATYAGAWRRWERWCTRRGLAPLPAHPSAVCAYLTECAATGHALGTLDVACSAITRSHRDAGLATPIAHESVRRVRRSLRRLVGTAPRRPAHALAPAEIRQILAAIDRGTVKGARDAAMILLGYAGALRCSELAALTLADLDPQPGGLLLQIRASKTDPDRRGQVVGVAPGQHPATDPITALDSWLILRGTAPGPLFTTMRGVHASGRIRIAPISPTAVADTVHDRAGTAGLPADRITGHSLRAGHATTAALAGVPIDRIAAQTRHRQIAVLIERYIRPAQALATTSSRDLGL
ncbi:integrase [Nocardioides gansuensis]|uniref:Integrase n=1 Tax=Nocardioides gansuensis TaxID=2138300 RepID=A0A2T8FCG5_9ACTN|nr:tyrosine-type recombinase/integrase [Nocardioides gansuensis]PVG83396.1 integrase [Nocardioides gansuensis]